jgi:hypothetical protein
MDLLGKWYGIAIRESGVLEKDGGLTGFLDFLDADSYR